MTLPHFVGLGALKAGTTTLHDHLAGHPQIALARDRKEVMFFDRHWERGADWYAQQFAHAGDHKAGEISPNYLFDPRVPQRMASVVPSARLLVVVRDPVDRAVSQYRHFVRERAWSRGLDAFLDAHPNAVERGLYAAQLRRVLDHFPREALLVLAFDDLVQHPEPTLRRVFGHLGVDDDHRTDAATVQANPAASARFPRLQRAGRRMARWAHDREMSGVVRRIKATGVHRILLQPPTPEDAPVSPAGLARLSDAYEGERERLHNLLGEDLGAGWRTADAR